MIPTENIKSYIDSLLEHVKAGQPCKVYPNEIKLMFGDRNASESDLSDAISELSKWAKEHNISVSTKGLEPSFLLFCKDYEEYLKQIKNIDVLEPAFIDKSFVDKGNAFDLMQISVIKTYENLLKEKIEEFTGRKFIREIDEPITKIHRSLSCRTYGYRYDYVVYNGMLLGTITWTDKELVFRPDLKFC